jgi:hypothetical protein
MWGPMPLMTVSTVVMTVWLSAEVVHIPHESWSSLLAGYSLYRWASLQTSRVCARTSLQGYSMVSPSLQHNHWGFTGGVSTYHQGPLLHSGESTPLPTRSQPGGSQESPLNPHHRLERPPMKTLPHTTSRRTYIGSWLYHFHGWSLHENGP